MLFAKTLLETDRRPFFAEKAKFGNLAQKKTTPIKYYTLKVKC